MISLMIIIGWLYTNIIDNKYHIINILLKVITTCILILVGKSYITMKITSVMAEMFVYELIQKIVFELFLTVILAVIICKRNRIKIFKNCMMMLLIYMVYLIEVFVFAYLLQKLGYFRGFVFSYLIELAVGVLRKMIFIKANIKQDSSEK